MTLERSTRDDTLILNVGPQHPSTHGVLRIVLELDGETIVRAEPVIGYLHTGFEKEYERRTYLQAVTLTDRMDYLATLINNLGYALAVEKLFDLEVPPRARVLRVLLAELTRINSHLVWLGTTALELGAMSVFLYCMRERELIMDLNEMISGARMMTSYIRPGGLTMDIPEGFIGKVEEFLSLMPGRIQEYEDLLRDNELWIERNRGIGILPAETALALGVTGPILRASGVAWDLRKAMPYSGYEEYDFDICVQTDADCYARYRVRVDEMRESLKIIRQALDRLPDGPVVTDDRKVAPPPRHELALSMEALIHHFKLFTEGMKPPAGEVYAAVESPRGELGFYVVSDGSGKPYRIHVRAPSFANLQVLAAIAPGHLVADLIAITASLDPVMGDVDR
ncbi:MAG: NADH dehydrogenase (quinone) subunit D [Chloroflexi bacterium]|nr:NADH dehydrogenase (quinone) subunit D [Chloroflexota bacterium]